MTWLSTKCWAHMELTNTVLGPDVELTNTPKTAQWYWHHYSRHIVLTRRFLLAALWHWGKLSLVIDRKYQNLLVNTGNGNEMFWLQVMGLWRIGLFFKIASFSNKFDFFIGLNGPRIKFTKSKILWFVAICDVDNLKFGIASAHKPINGGSKSRDIKVSFLFSWKQKSNPLNDWTPK